MRSIAPLLLTSCVLSLAGCGGYAGPSVRNLRPQLADRPTDVRIVSVNLRRPVRTDGFNYWEHRKFNLAATLRHINPDIVATQECIESQAQYLDQSLPGYQRVGAGRDDGRGDGEMCAVFFDTRRFDLIDSGNFWLSENPQRPGSSFGGAWFPRMVTWVQLRDRAVNRSLYVFNTHFSIFSEEARVASARLLRQQIQRVAGSGPVVVTGDFNDGEGSTTYQLLTRAVPLADTYRVLHPQRSAHEGTRHGFRGNTNGDRLDWILASDEFAPCEASIVRSSMTGRPVSDHYPVFATLRWITSATLALQPDDAGYTAQ